MNSAQGLSAPRAAKAPAAKINKSPGRKGITTTPVSTKMIAASIARVQAPYWAIMSLR